MILNRSAHAAAWSFSSARLRHVRLVAMNSTSMVIEGTYWASERSTVKSKVAKHVALVSKARGDTAKALEAFGEADLEAVDTASFMFR